MIFVSSFDPITQSELEEIIAYHKAHRNEKIVLSVQSNGTIPLTIRKQLVKRAIQPYRYMHIGKDNEEGKEFDSANEIKVRNGSYRLAAKGIRNILWEKGYYIEATVQAMCKPKRATHSFGVADTAKHLAHYHQVDEEVAYRSGLCHDLTKAFSDEQNKKIIAIWKKDWLTLSPKVWHSYTAVIWLKQEMCCHDEKILQAIEHHTLGDGKSKLDHILFIADKIEPGRGYDASRELHLAERNLKEASHLVYLEGEEYRHKHE